MQVTEMVLPQSVDCMELKDIPFKVLKSIEGNLVWAGEADIDGSNGAEHMAVTECEMVFFDSGHSCLQRIPLDEVVSIVGCQHNVIVSHKKESYTITPIKESVTLLLQTLWRVHKTTSYNPNHGLENFPASRVPVDLTPALSILYDKGTPQIHWLGWVLRRDDPVKLTYTKKTLLVTETAMYIGNIEESGNKITRCISFDKINCISQHRTELAFRVPSEYDLILKEESPGVIDVFKAMFSPIHQSESQLTGRVVKCSEVSCSPLIPIKISQKDLSETHIPVSSPFNLLSVSDVPVNVRSQFSGYKNPAILWISNILRTSTSSGVTAVSILTPEDFYVVETLDITNVLVKVSVKNISSVATFKRIWCSLRTVDGVEILFHPLDPPSDQRAAAFVAACESITALSDASITCVSNDHLTSPSLPKVSFEPSSPDTILDLMCAGHASTTVSTERERNDNSSLSAGSLQDSASGMSNDLVKKPKTTSQQNTSDLRIILPTEHLKRSGYSHSPKSPTNLGVRDRRPSLKTSPQQLSSSASDFLDAPLSLQRSNSARSNHDTDTGLPFISYSQLSPTIRCCFDQLYKQGRPEIVWANIVTCFNKKPTSRSLVVTPRAVYLGAKSVFVRCIPLGSVSYVVVAGLKIALKIPSQYDLLLEVLEEATARSFICVLCAVVKSLTGALLKVDFVDKLTPSQWTVTKPHGLSQVSTIPIAVY
eukprot:TRINITY_DN15218_c0_g1_i1.p1 TRINITY_DN15218_c0_g1~~TRINITY_DN15218_c0_g1_i1.p1  ORF type:complete len:709 (+),score=90.99 TRINITY_DN15218_c0_g1_i1:99-2225(+)